MSEGKPIRVDPAAVSADGALPAFIARPQGEPVYHGFHILEASEVEGFRLGMISDFITQPDTDGDAFVVAPDNSRAGLIWESEVTEPYFSEVLPPTPDRWGVWGAGSRLPLRTESDAREFLRSLLPLLVPRWDAWRSSSR
jgi:hypothetical protein